MRVNSHSVFELFDGIFELSHAHIAVAKRHPSWNTVRIFINFLAEKL